MSVIEIKNDSQFESELTKAGKNLVVVDFTASWCGPCKRIAPEYAQFPKKFPQVTFLKVDVDDCQELASAHGVNAMPTFNFYRNKAKVDSLEGADPDGLIAKIKQNIRPDDESGSSFAGKGHTLGSPQSVANPTSSSDDNEKNEKFANEVIHMDPNQPNTTIQIRLSDGSRLTGRFNLSHTIGDLRLFITTARPQYGSVTFSLLTTFPNKELADAEQTIQAAGIMNASITQQLK